MVENRTEYQLEILKDFIRYSIKRNCLITLISSAVILFCAIIEVSMEEYLLGCIFATLGVFFLIMAICLVPISIKKATLMPNIVNEYQFLPESLNVTTFSNGENLGNSTIPYSRIIKVVENKNCLYLYLNKVQALIVDTRKFSENLDKEVVITYIKNNQVTNNITK